MGNNKKQHFRYLIVNALFAAIAYLSVLVFKVSSIGGFLTMDIKDALMAVAAMFFGSISAVLLPILVSVMELTISGTGIYGLIMNIIGSLAFTLTAALIYKYKKTFFGAIIALISASFVMIAVMLVANLFITPFYTGMSRSTVAALIPALLFPFNLVKGVLNSAVTLLLYKPVSVLMKRFGFKNNIVKESGKLIDKRYSIITVVVSVLLISVSIYVIITMLGGNITVFDADL